MNTPRKTIRISDEDWRRLQEIAASLVDDKDVAAKARDDSGKLSAMLRLIAAGRLIVASPR
jgi:hypothetical protein